MAIECFENLIGTWAPAGWSRGDASQQLELFHFSPLGHFVMEWREREETHRQICELVLTDEGFAFTHRGNGGETVLAASLHGDQLVLVPPHGEETILERVVEEMAEGDFEFFVRG